MEVATIDGERMVVEAGEPSQKNRYSKRYNYRARQNEATRI